MADPDLVRFVDAQAPVRQEVTGELAAGRKRTHWMWFVFPQLAGLGHSDMARHYAISDLDQARRYLSDAVLGERLRHDVRLLLGHKGKTAREIFGLPDDLKFRSCLTLFIAAASDKADRLLFSEALSQFYQGRPDERTCGLLDGDLPPLSKAEHGRLQQ